MRIPLLIIVSILCSCNGLGDRKSLPPLLFADCAEADPAIQIVTADHELFKVSFPSYWMNEPVGEGVRLRSAEFSDGWPRIFTLARVPFQEEKMQGSEDDFHRFEHGTFNDHKAIWLIENDRDPHDDGTVMWHSEIRVAAGDEMYLIAMERRHDRNTEPDWCDFAPMIGSLVLKEKDHESHAIGE